MKLPDKVNICGIEHTITYVDKPSEVDIHKRDSMWGYIDFWTRTIRIYDNGQPIEDVFRVILHEIIHGIAFTLHLKEMGDKENHDELDLLAVALCDVLCRNGWIEIER